MIILTIAFNAIGQDFHYSQFNSSQLNLNPALTGNFSEDYQFAMNNRNQWQAVSVPFSVLSASFEGKLNNLISSPKIKDNLETHNASVGILFNRDKAGDSEFGTTKVALSLSYSFRISSDSSQMLSLGIQSGIAQRSMNFNKLTWDSQYDNIQYIPSLNSGETLLSDNYSFFDVSMGANWNWRINEKIKSQTGVAVFHLNQPAQSFYNDKSVILYQKQVLTTRISYQLNDNWQLFPSILYTKQKTQTELTIGSEVKYKPFLTSENSKLTNIGVLAGTWLRYGDALIFLLGADYQNLTAGLSYDINVSGLSKASSGKGAFELALIYRFNFKFKKSEEKEMDHQRGNFPVFL